MRRRPGRDRRWPRVVARVDLARRRCPSSSATCSTSDGQDQRVEVGAGLAAVLDRAGGTAPAASAGPPLPRTSDDSGTVPVSQSSGICGVSSTAYSTRPSRSAHRSLEVGDDVEHELVEPLPRRAAAPARPGAAGSTPGPACRGRAGRAPARRPGRGRHGSEPKPPGLRRGYRRRRESARRCSRTACGRPAVTTLTYVYADQTAVLGPLATYAEPHAYDLCDVHCERLQRPAGLGGPAARARPDAPAARPTDDLLALADAVREAARPVPVAVARPGAGDRPRGRPARGHLRMLTTD